MAGVTFIVTAIFTNSIIYFTNPTYVNSFQMTGMPS